MFFVVFFCFFSPTLVTFFLVVGGIVAPKRYITTATPGTRKCDLIWKRGVFRPFSVKGLEMKRSSCIIQGRPKCGNKGLIRITQGRSDKKKRRGPCDHGGRDWSDAGTAKTLPYSPQRECGPADTWISDFGPRAPQRTSVCCISLLRQP